MPGRIAAILVFLFVAIAAVIAPQHSVRAQDGASAAQGSMLLARDFRMAGDANRMRVVVEFDREPDLRWFLLRSPHRIVLDLPETAFAFDPESLEARGFLREIRYGALGEGRARMILAADGPFLVEKIATLENENSPGWRLVMDVVSGSEDAFEEALRDQSATTGTAGLAPKGDRLGKPDEQPERRFTVVVDAGHGGIDGGAEGANGTVEKDLTLAFATELRARIEEDGRYAVHMTRDDDSFLRLDERVRIGRQHNADLFISIHADTIRMKDIRGATVYTISERASDAVAAAAADRENLADSVAGIVIEEENQQVADILVDLIRRETHGFSVAFARTLIGKLTDSVELINNPHRSAGFRVLRAPDMPSVLVELGYLSNRDDEALMNDPQWRRKAAGSILEAIALFARAKREAGG